MRKIIFLAITFCLLTAGTAAAEVKIGVFSMQEVATKSDAFKEATKTLDATFSREKKDLEAQQNSLKQKAEALQSQAKGLSEEAREDKQVEYMRLKRDLDDKTRLFVRKVETEERKIQQNIATTIIKAVQAYGQRQGYTLIMDAASAGVIHAAPSIDLTEDILKETNQLWKTSPKTTK